MACLEGVMFQRRNFLHFLTVTNITAISAHIFLPVVFALLLLWGSNNGAYAEGDNFCPFLGRRLHIVKAYTFDNSHDARAAVLLLPEKEVFTTFMNEIGEKGDLRVFIDKEVVVDDETNPDADK